MILKSQVLKRIDKIRLVECIIQKVENVIKKHYEVVAAVIVKDKTFFCCQRGNKGECAYKWEFPGGKIEPGETKEEALVREIKEELNSTIKVNKYLATINHEYNSFSLTMHAYECELANGKLEISEHFDSRWLKKEELKELDFAEADKKIIKQLV
jgi:8-oxo-dGTP diphosphatase